jgi:hypothetical protein
MTIWLKANLANIIALAVIALAAVAALFALRRQKQLSGTICANCPKGASCGQACASLSLSDLGTGVPPHTGNSGDRGNSGNSDEQQVPPGERKS